MSREFLVWFKPVADALFALFTVSCVCCFAMSVIMFVVTCGIDESEQPTRSGSMTRVEKMKWRMVSVILAFVMLLFGIGVAVVNPLTNGPKLYDETHKAACQCKKAK